MTFVRYNLFTFFWAGIILFLTLTPGTSIGHLGLNFIDKFVHFSLFMVFSMLMIVGFRKQNSYLYVNLYAHIFTLVITVLFGLCIEFGQIVIPGRDFDVLDIVFNVLGTLSGLGTYYLIYKL